MTYKEIAKMLEEILSRLQELEIKVNHLDGDLYKLERRVDNLQ